MFSIYRDAWRAMRENFTFFLIIAVLLTAAEIFLADQRGAQSGITVAWVVIALYLHRYFVLGEKVPLMKPALAYEQKPKIFRFVALAFGLGVVAAALALAICLPVLSGRGLDRDVQVGVTMLVVGVIYFILLSMFGTVFPALAIGAPSSDIWSWRRIRATTGPTMLGLLIGPVAFSALGLGALVLFVLYGDARWFEYQSAAGQYKPVGLLLSVLLYLGSAYSTVLGVATFCRVYQESQIKGIAP